MRSWRDKGIYAEVWKINESVHGKPKALIESETRARGKKQTDGNHTCTMERVNDKSRANEDKMAQSWGDKAQERTNDRHP